uniref:CD3 gamma/delta subunit Ig-like domain-containing protein n=1 Tax=Cyprinus carpio TaxID=7962 RepID=A0A8C2E3Y9_CYPCA
ILTLFVHFILSSIIFVKVIKEIKEDSVILDCEVVGDATVKWFKDKTEDKEQTKTTFEAKAKQGVVEGVFTCEFSKTDTNPIKHTFYLKIKVCENCYELSGLTGWGIMFGDVLITGGVIIIIYFCAARNSDGPPKKASNPRSVNPPRPPNPDYAVRVTKQTKAELLMKLKLLLISLSVVNQHRMKSKLSCAVIGQ